ncbi:MAG: helix-turn-helix domain-containing protein [Fastidiosipilaceae bacterium]
MDLCETIKSIRRKCLLSQTDFAHALGVSFSTVNRWENGKATPNYQALQKIKEFCNINNLPFDVDRKVWEEKE